MQHIAARNAGRPGERTAQDDVPISILAVGRDLVGQPRDAGRGMIQHGAARPVSSITHSCDSRRLRDFASPLNTLRRLEGFQRWHLALHRMRASGASLG